MSSVLPIKSNSSQIHNRKPHCLIFFCGDNILYLCERKLLHLSSLVYSLLSFFFLKTKKPLLHYWIFSRNSFSFYWLFSCPKYSQVTFMLQRKTQQIKNHFCALPFLLNYHLIFCCMADKFLVRGHLIFPFLQLLPRQNPKCVITMWLSPLLLTYSVILPSSYYFSLIFTEIKCTYIIYHPYHLKMYTSIVLIHLYHFFSFTPSTLL